MTNPALREWFVDITKRWCLKVFQDQRISIEWLQLRETDEYETDIMDKKELQIRIEMGDILKQLLSTFSKRKMLFPKIYYYMLKQYAPVSESAQFARSKNYKGNTNEADIAKVMGRIEMMNITEIMLPGYQITLLMPQ